MVVREGLMAGSEAAGHTMTTRREMDAGVELFHCIHSRTPVHGMVPSTFRVDYFKPQLADLCHRHAQRFIF